MRILRAQPVEFGAVSIGIEHDGSQIHERKGLADFRAPAHLRICLTFASVPQEHRQGEGILRRRGLRRRRAFFRQGPHTLPLSVMRPI